MSSGARLVHWVVWGLLALVVVSIAGVFLLALLHPQATPLPVYGQVADFNLTNQLGRAVSLAELKGHVWVADVIFTRCPGPCVGMTRKMKAIQESLPTKSAVRLVSLTADPAFDTPPVLEAYATRFKADQQNWSFLTGPKQVIYDLATQSLKLAVQENSTTNVDEMFIHSTRLVVVDRLGQLRAVGRDGSDQRTVSDVLRAVDQLLNER
jgi:protein SCO1